MVTCTTPPFRAAVRLNSGVSAQKMLRTTTSVLLFALGLCCFGVFIWVVGTAAYEYATLPAPQYKDSVLSVPALIVPVFCGLVLLALGQRIRMATRGASNLER